MGKKDAKKKISFVKIFKRKKEMVKLKNFHEFLYIFFLYIYIYYIQFIYLFKIFENLS